MGIGNKEILITLWRGEYVPSREKVELSTSEVQIMIWRKLIEQRKCFLLVVALCISTKACSRWTTVTCSYKVPTKHLCNNASLTGFQSFSLPRNSLQPWAVHRLSLKPVMIYCWIGLNSGVSTKEISRPRDRVDIVICFVSEVRRQNTMYKRLTCTRW